MEGNETNYLSVLVSPMKGGRAAFLQEVDQVRLGFVPDMFVTYHPLDLNRVLPISPKASFAVTDGKYSRIVKHCSHLAIHENYSLIPMGSMCCVPPNHHPHTLAYSAGPRCSCCFWFPAKKVLCNPSQVGPAIFQVMHGKIFPSLKLFHNTRRAAWS